MVLMFGVQMLVNATAEIDVELVGTGLRRQGSEGSSSSTEPLVPIAQDESGHEHTVV